MTLAQIKEANANAGLHYFEPSTMRFFRSRVSDRVYQGPGGIYLVTSEKGPRDTAMRRYTVRIFDPGTGRIETAHGCPFNEWTRSRAHRVASAMAKGRG